MKKKLLDSVSIEELKQMYESGMSYKDIANSLEVSYQTIYSADFKKTLHEKIKQYAHGSPQRNMLYAVLQWLDKEPRIDAEPVRHGRWIMRGGCIRCSECDAKTLWKDAGGTGGFSHEYEQVRASYCPNCGAKMDGDERA